MLWKDEWKVVGRDAYLLLVGKDRVQLMMRDAGYGLGGTDQKSSLKFHRKWISVNLSTPMLCHHRWKREMGRKIS